jgi:hypothetical protein
LALVAPIPVLATAFLLLAWFEPCKTAAALPVVAWAFLHYIRFAMTIVRTDYRYKPPPKRKPSPSIPQRIVSAKQPKPPVPVIDKTVVATPRRPAAQAAAISNPRIVTAPRKRMTRFGPVPDFDAEEHQRRGDAAEALFRELVRRATWNAGK